jgi:hypothetical protein
MPDRLIESAGQGFEESFGAVMVIFSGQQAGMQVKTGFVGQAFEEVGDQAGAQLADFWRVEMAVKDKVAPPANINSHQSQRFIHRHNSAAHAGDTAPVSQRLLQSASQNNTHILNRMVFINVQVAHGLNGQVKASMAGQSVQHVVKKTDAGLDFGLASAVKVEGQGYIGFIGLAANRCLSLGHHSTRLHQKVCQLIGMSQNHIGP